MQTLPSPVFDRLDICQAYLALEWDWNTGGILKERPSCARRLRSVASQLNDMGVRTPLWFEGFESLTDNGKAIYHRAVERLGLLGG
jgi:hypothetical protein